MANSVISRRLTIGHRLILINALLAAAIVAVSVMASKSFDALEREAALTRTLSDARSFNQDADMMHDGLRADLYALLLGNQTGRKDAASSRDDLRANGSQLRDDLSSLSSLDLGPELQSMIAHTREAAEAYVATADSIAELALRDHDAAVARMPEFDQRFDGVLVALAAQTEALGGQMDLANQRSAIVTRDSNRWLVAAGVLTNIVVALLVTLISRSIRGSLSKIAESAQRMASGDLGARNDVHTSDEIGQLAEHINAMAGNLEGMMTRVRSDAERSSFGTQLTEALEMADTEPEAHAVIARAMNMVSPEHPMELLLADSSRAHLEVAAEHPEKGGSGCNVESPFSCVAVRRGNPVVFEDSEALNACPRLRGRSAGRISAACVPVSFMGRALGVLHATAALDQQLSAEAVHQLTTLGIQAGARIGTVRAFERTQVQASTDGLTGLANRRSLEGLVRTLLQESKSFAFVLADLDKFKSLNDSHGHEAGDAALRLFSDVARKGVRDGDLVARWGGEEFVFVLVNSTATQALDWVERMRAQLADAQRSATTPSFTASYGIADTSMTKSLEELARIADRALYASKNAGRDRGTIGSPSMLSMTEKSRPQSEQKAAVSIRLLANEA